MPSIEQEAELFYNNTIFDRVSLIEKGFAPTDLPIKDLEKIHLNIFDLYVPKEDAFSKDLLVKENQIMKISLVNEKFMNNRAGEFRPDYGDWGKTREGFGWKTSYSSLSSEDYSRTSSAILEARNIIKQTSDKDIISSQLAKAYHQMDFLHTFYDGNSRTNRTYINLLAKEKDLIVDWSKINRKDFYLARDIELIKNYQTYGEYLEIKEIMAESREKIETTLKTTGKPADFSIEKLIRENLTYNSLTLGLKNTKKYEASKMQNSIKDFDENRSNNIQNILQKTYHFKDDDFERER